MILLKIKGPEENKAISVGPEQLTHDYALKRVQEWWPHAQVSPGQEFTYKDSDNDTITVTNNEEMKEAVRFAQQHMTSALTLTL